MDQLIEAVKESDRRDAPYLSNRDKKYEPTIVSKPKVEAASQMIKPKESQPQVIKPTTSSDFKCFNCDEQGHSAKVCPYPRNQNKLNQEFENLKLRSQNQQQPQAGSSRQPQQQQQTQQRKEDRRAVTSNYRGQKRSRNNSHVSGPEDQATEPPNKRRSDRDSDDQWEAHEQVTPKREEQENRHMAYTVTNLERFGTIKTLLSNRDSPILPVLINGRKVRALFDTGGVITLVSDYLSRFLKLKLNSWAFDGIKGVTGSIIPDGIATDVTVAFQDQVITMDVTVVPGLTPHVILGIDYLKSARLSPSAFKSITTTPDVPSDAVLPYPSRTITKKEYETLMHAPTITFPGARRRRIRRPEGQTTDEDSGSEETIVTSESSSEITAAVMPRSSCFCGTPQSSERCRSSKAQTIQISHSSSDPQAIARGLTCSLQSAIAQTARQRKKSRKRRYKETPPDKPPVLAKNEQDITTKLSAVTRLSTTITRADSRLKRTDPSSSLQRTEPETPDTISPQVSTDDDRPMAEPNVGSLFNLINDHIKVDQIFGPIFQALEEGTASEYLTSNFKLTNGRLFKTTYDQGVQRPLLCVPYCAAPNVFECCHDDMDHPGQKKTKALVSKYFYWPRMNAMTEEYVRTCKSCQVSKPSNTRPAGLQMPLSVPTVAFQQIAMDCIGPIRPVPPSGKRYILTIVDRATKWTFAEALTDITSQTIIPVVESFFYHYGIPETVLTDNATDFLSRSFEAFLASLHIKHLYTSVERPQTNGQCEQVNNIIMTALRARQSPDNWHRYVKPVVFAYNCSLNHSTGQEPYYQVFGSHPRRPFHNELEISPDWVTAESREDILVELATARLMSRDKVKQLQHRNKKAADAHRRESDFSIGQLVLLYETKGKTRGMGKLANPYAGPFVISSQLSENIYRITPLEDDGRYMNVRAERLKVYHPRSHTAPATSEPIASASNTSDNDADTESDGAENPFTGTTEEYEVGDLHSLSPRPKRTRRRPKKLDDFVTFAHRV